jgi:amidase
MKDLTIMKAQIPTPSPPLDAAEGGARSAVSRREFLGSTAVAGAAVALGGISRQVFAALPANELLSKSASQIAQMIRDKQVTAVEVVKACYARIDEVNPKINAVVATCRERALVEAQLADEALAAGKSLGPLHGVPFTIKDSFDTEGVVSTGGTLGRVGYVPGKDATVVARVRKAGAILLGKTNTPEFTLGGGARGTYNLIYGQTHNAYDPAYTPAGSSGGAGAIVAAGGSYFDIGSDYGGSIRLPANVEGLAGIKPTYGRSPRTGHIVGYGGPFDNFQETGPLTRSVDDLYLILSIICGPDNWDAAMAPVPLGDPKKVDLKTLRVAWYTNTGTVEASSEMKSMVKQCVGYFSSLGCKVKADAPPKLKELSDVRQEYEGADDRDHIRRLMAKHRTVQASPGLRTDGKLLPSADFTRLLEEMDAIKSEQLAWFENYDLIICPVMAKSPEKIPVEFTRTPAAAAALGSFCGEYNTTGWPAGVVRAGTSKDSPGLPLDIHVIAQPWRDDVVLAALGLIEGKTGGWKMPPI